MADKYYAWSTIHYGAEKAENDPKQIVKVLKVNPGDEVTASKLNLTEDQFQELVDGGSARDYPMPKELIDDAASPNQLIAQGLADTETVAATVGVSPELVEAYSKQQKKQQTPVKGEIKG